MRTQQYSPRDDLRTPAKTSKYNSSIGKASPSLNSSQTKVLISPPPKLMGYTTETVNIHNLNDRNRERNIDDIRVKLERALSQSPVTNRSGIETPIADAQHKARTVVTKTDSEREKLSSDVENHQVSLSPRLTERNSITHVAPSKSTS